MTRVVKTTFKFKRGHTEDLVKFNIVPQDGEPVFDLDLGKLKIGDGHTPYNDLKYIGEDSVYNSKTSFGFPSIGEPNVIYKAEKESKLYQWDTEKLQYVELTPSEDILMISGGNSNSFN